MNHSSRRQESSRSHLKTRSCLDVSLPTPASSLVQADTRASCSSAVAPARHADARGVFMHLPNPDTLDAYCSALNTVHPTQEYR